MAAYIGVGTTLCLLNFARADARHMSDFVLYLVCAITTTLGLKLTTHRSAIPASFLVMLLAIQDLTLPELLFIACVVSLLGQIQEAKRGLPKGAALVFSMTSGSIGIATAQTVYHAISVLKYNALFPAPVIGSALVLLLNWGMARTLTKDASVSLSEVLIKECRPVLPWFVGVAYLAYLVRGAAIVNEMNAGLVALPMLFALDTAFRAWFDSKAKHREELDALQKRSLAKLAALHQRTLETLAVAIDGRDHTTHMHLRRVQFYVRAVGKELNLTEEQLEHLNV